MASPYDIVPGKIFLGGIAATTTQETIFKHFASFGEIIDCVVMQDRATGKSRGFGFVTYRDSTVTHIVLSQVHIIDGKEIDCKRAVPRDQKPEISKEEASMRTKKLFVGGLPQTVTEEIFKGYFEQFGKVDDWVIMVDKVTGKSRGFGFITFDNEDSVELVISRYLENKIDGKWVECKKALPKDSQNNSQSSTTNASPAVSAYSSKKNSLNKQSGESDLEIVRSILAEQQRAKLSVDSEAETSQMSYLESKLQAVAKLSENNPVRDNPIQSDPFSKVWNEDQGETEKGNFQVPQMYPYHQRQQQPSGGSLITPQLYSGYSYNQNLQQFQQSQIRFIGTQETNPLLETNSFTGQEPAFINDTKFSNSNKYIQPITVEKHDRKCYNFPPGLHTFDGNSYPSSNPISQSTSFTNQNQIEPIIQIKGSLPTPQQQQQPPSQKKVEKYIPLYS